MVTRVSVEQDGMHVGREQVLAISGPHLACLENRFQFKYLEQVCQIK